MPGNDLAEAASRLGLATRYGGIHDKRQALVALANTSAVLAAVSAQIAEAFGDRGYGPEITEPLGQAASAFTCAGARCGDAFLRLDELLSTPVGSLAGSGREVPHNSELNGGS